jgi:general secretion pathway protein A
MYEEFFALGERPFALLPDPRFLFLSRCHREALAHLLYGIEQGEGFIEVVGQVGTGKTTLCRTLLERVSSDVEIAYIFNPSRSELELLIAVNREFGLATAARSRSELIEELNQFLLRKKAEGKSAVLVIDEAQNLDDDVLEQIRLLSNLETQREKLLQIVLIGQPELERNLSKIQLRQLRQRITVRWALRAFDRQETAEYVRHRMRVAGRVGPDVFTARALRALYRYSAGTPRTINAIADRALLSAYSRGEAEVGARTVRAAARELPGAEKVEGAALGVRNRTATGLLAAGVVIGFLSAALWPLEADSSRPGVLLAPGPAQPEAEAEAPATAIPVRPHEFAGPLAEPVALTDFAMSSPADLLHAEADVTSGAALRSVLAAWGYPAPSAAAISPNAIASAVREVSALRVYVTRSNLTQLAQLGLPAILELEPAPHERRYVALLELPGEGRVTIALDDSKMQVDELDLERFWTGRAFLVWDNFERLPALGPDMNGTAVRWLQARLTELGYMRRGDASGWFDRHTADAVRNFQREQALNSNGSVGPATMIALYRALGYPSPRLVAADGIS